MAGSLYGIANPLAEPAIYGTPSGADVSLGAGTENTFITTGAIAALNRGMYYPSVALSVTILLGAMAPAALQFAMLLGSGSDVDVYVVEPGLLVALAELVIAIPLRGVLSGSAWVGSGSVVNLTYNATTNDITVKGVGTRALVSILRGPD